ncbi:MAG: DUF4932 domain-containing protein [Ferruginibacter sp.]
MMKQRTLLISIFLSLVFTIQLKAQTNKINVEFNANLATYSIVEHLVAEHLGWLFYIDGKADIAYLPMAAAARDEMNKHDNSRIIQQMLDYLKVTGNQQDFSYHALLRHNTFPDAGYKYSFDGLDIDTAKMKALKTFVENLRRFYIERNLQNFFTDYRFFFNGIINEVKQNIPPAYINKMEKYYGQSISAYNYYPNPFDVVPYDTVFWHGNGPIIKTKNGYVASMMTSAYLPLDKKSSINDYSQFGFNHPATINTIITHEFGHSFVNPVLEKYERKINESSSLMSDALVNKMGPIGYGNWLTCIIEHLVRLGEIRIALTNGNAKKADSLRNVYINDFGFVLIPDFEKKIVEYERNITKYKSFKVFVPTLLTVLDTISVEQVRKKLGLPTEIYSVTINVHVPKNSGEVFITGNQSAVGNWDPQKIKLNKLSDSTLTITFATYADLKFKFTKGDWETEGIVEGLEEGKDINPTLMKDTELSYVVLKWKK